jgi:hypothetical protein
MKALVAVCILATGASAGCASIHPDHFYVLSASPGAAPAALSAPALEAALKVSLPAVVDRPEFVLSTSAQGVVVLEHERWAAPLLDLVTQTLARDIERRRAGLLVAVPGNTRPAPPAFHVAVDIVQLTVRRGQDAVLEAHWRIVDAKTHDEAVGAGTFSTPLKSGGYADVAQAISDDLASLADRLAAGLPQS